MNDQRRSSRLRPSSASRTGTSFADPGPSSGVERAQTLIDYQIGIAVFLLAVAFVFLFLPSVFAPHTAPVDASQTEQSDRVADEVLTAITREDASNTLDTNATEDFFAGDEVNGIPMAAGTSVNVTLVDGYGERQESVGDPHDGESTAATTRVVIDEPGADADRYSCTETCRIEVRVWR